jgi:hypothetical protein
MSNAVVTGPQMSMARVLTPYKGFADDYQGVSGYTPLMVTEGGVAVDYSQADLLKGIPVTMGSRIVMWVPSVASIVAGDVVDYYNWFPTWRLRNVHDLITAQLPAHYPSSQPGRGGQYFVPAAAHSVVYNQAEPAISTGDAAVQKVYLECFQVQPGRSPIGFPLIPGGGPSTYQTGTNLTQPSWQVFDFTCQGDELLLGVYKASGTPWDFNGADLYIGGILSAQGAFVSFGVSP